MLAPGRWACPGFPRGAEAMGVEEPRGESRRRRAEVSSQNGRQNHRVLRSSRSRGTSLRSLAIGGHNPSARARHRTYWGALSGRPAWEGLLCARSPAEE